MRNEYKAVVVGAGPIGAALALSLAKVLDKADTREAILLVDSTASSPAYEPDTPDVRLFAVNAGSQNMLENLDVWRAIASERCEPYQRMHVWDSQGTGKIEFDAIDLGESQLGHIVEANLILSKLLSALSAQPNLDIVRPEKVSEITNTEEHIELHLESERVVRTELVCAADGAKSSLRDLLGIDTFEDGVGQQAIVANIFHEFPHQSCAWQIFHSTGPLAFLPMADHDGKHLSSIVWSIDSEEAESVMNIPSEEFEIVLARAIEQRFGKLELASERFSFPLVQRHASTYAKPCFALVGDAAHSILPLAGLGANIGFQDVQALASELERATERGIFWGDEKVLMRYQRSRKIDNELTLKAMKGFKELFGKTTPTVSTIRNFGLKLADASPTLKRQFIQQAMMIRQ